MFKLKKLISLFLCLVMLSSVLLTSCDSGNDTPSDTSGNQSESTGQHTHTPASAVTENLIDSTCTQMGSYDEVVYCSVCNEEISRTTKTIEKKAHEYNQKVTTDTYLESEATCTDSAIYSYSCICGEKGDSAFTYGEATGHSYTSAWEKDAIHHWHKANCEHTSEISEKIEHDFGTDNICDICEYVRGIAVSGITLNYTSFAAMVGDVKTLIATITPDDATNKKVMWTTSNSAVITVDESGVVTAVGAGNAIVYAVTEDGAKIAQCIVVVIDNDCLHTTTRVERENEIDSTCKEVGSYDEVVYCSACGDELSRTQKEIAKKETHTPITDARVEPTFTETGLTEGSHCGVCGFVIVAQEVIPVKPSKSDLLSENLTVNATNISGKVSYATTEFNFANDISVTNSGTWVLSTDVNGVHTIITKKAPLSEGNNVFYIHVENPDKSVTTYTVNIYRNHIYTVSFDTDGGTGVEPQYVEEGYLATAPSTNKTGYTFVSWNYDFDTPITANITIKANWNANTGTAYRVEYYLENVDKNGYDIVSSETENLTGTTDTTANAEQKTFTHFTLNTSKSILSGNINGNGSLVLKVYYTRNTYTVSTSRNNTKGGTVTSGGSYAYDTEITLIATTNAGYTFLGWFEGETKVCDSLTYTFKVDHTATYTAKWSANTNTTYKVEYYFENVDKNGYDIVSAETENLAGTTDTTANAEQKTFDHFTLNTSKSTLSGNINGNGSLVLKVYYTRNAYSVNSDDTSIGTVNNGGSYGYNKQITVSASVSKLGYTFIGWYSGEDLLSSDSEYTINIDKNVVAKFDVAEEMKNFNFTSDATTCSITGIKNKTVTEIILPDYVTSIGEGAFSNCINLTNIVLSEKLTDIGNSAFFHCYRLVEVINQSSINLIQGSEDCGGVAKYALEIHQGTVKGAVNADNYLFYTVNDTNYLIGYIGQDSILTLPEDYNGENYVINKFAFKSSNITSVIISNGVTNIGEEAFRESSLVSVTIPNSTVSIGEDAFVWCFKLVEVVNNSSLDVVTGTMENGWIAYYAKEVHSGASKIVYKDNYIFYSHDGSNYLLGYIGKDEKLSLPENYNGQNYEIYNYAFDNDYFKQNNFTEIIIPNSVTRIGESAFHFCENLKNVTISDNVTEIGSRAFFGCYALEKFELPVGIIKIGLDAFPSNCKTNKNGVYYVGDWVVGFNHNTSTVTIVDGTVGIADGAFQFATSLVSVYIPNSIKFIGSEAFLECNNLIGVTFENLYDDWNCLWSGGLDIERVVSCYDLQNPQTAAEYLKSTYCYYCWCKIV